MYFIYSEWSIQYICYLFTSFGCLFCCYSLMFLSLQVVGSAVEKSTRWEVHYRAGAVWSTKRCFQGYFVVIILLLAWLFDHYQSNNKSLSTSQTLSTTRPSIQTGFHSSANGFLLMSFWCNLGCAGFVQTLEVLESLKVLRYPGLESCGKRHRSWKTWKKAVVLEILLPALHLHLLPDMACTL